MITGPLNTGFYARRAKRWLDVLLSAIGLVLWAPLFVLIAIAVRLDSSGPAIFRQWRTGKNGREFVLFKFRSMRAASEGADGITVAGEPRITPVGRLLRSGKLDELPQLWNVLRGEMSLVGPRPELPRYVALYSSDQREVLRVRPGITDPASITYVDEERLLGADANPERAYIERILPDKLAISRDYIREITFLGDLRIVASTLNAIVSSPAVAARRPG